MADPNSAPSAPKLLSASVQMYLLTITLLRMDDQAVPLSRLAQALDISPVSVNEMCRKLQDEGLVTYQPYTGVSLTEAGERQANYVLRRHRLWEVLLVKKLGYQFDEAHEIACQLEHATPDSLADRLDQYLQHPSVNPMGQVIPRPDGSLPSRPLTSLATLSAGQQAHVIRCDVSEATRDVLFDWGLRPGASLMVLASTEDRLLVRQAGKEIALAQDLAELILVEAMRKDI